VVLFALALAGAAGAQPRHVTLITDSVGGSLGWDAAAARTFTRGLDVDFELGPCRRLTTTGCPAGNGVPESALVLIERLGARLGPNVVIDVGYNDYPTVYALGIEQVLRALRSAGVQHVFWVTLRATGGPYAETNGAILGAARRHPELTVIDWNACAAGHDDWFGGDGVHLTDAGAMGLAECLRAGVLKVLDAPPPLEVGLAFPRGVTAGFHARLRASGGRAPYQFTVRGLPRGLRAAASGAISGRVVASGSYRLRVHVRDAAGRSASVVVPFDVSTPRRG
jgi:hypothetical protein